MKTRKPKKRTLFKLLSFRQRNVGTTRSKKDIKFHGLNKEMLQLEADNRKLQKQLRAAELEGVAAEGVIKQLRLQILAFGGSAG